MLPQEFTDRMKRMLGEEYAAFAASCGGERSRALRRSRLRLPGEIPLPFSLTPVPWCADGFYYEAPDEPGRHPLHEAGAYYIQEPSAMLPAGLLEAQPGERVLDLCAAPGGKSTQLAEAMRGRGVLLCNEIHPARARILSENIERMGVTCAIVTNETPGHLAARFPGWFDRILVDAPCSGEGMFRKNELACQEWSLRQVALCAGRQDAILAQAAAMLRPGGRLVYSTCTFAPEENEGSVSRFLQRFPAFSLAETERLPGMRGGAAEWVCGPAPGLEKTIRLWPHCVRGEGHFAAVLQKEGGAQEREAGRPEAGRGRGKTPDGFAAFAAFWEETIGEKLPLPPAERMRCQGGQLYLLPEGAPSLDGLKVLRPGLHLGTLRKDRLEPAHALSHALPPGQVRRVFPLSGQEAAAYLGGAALPAEGEKGWYLVTVSGCGLGWGKLAGGLLKNHYPKGLRKPAGT